MLATERELLAAVEDQARQAAETRPSGIAGRAQLQFLENAVTDFSRH